MTRWVALMIQLGKFLCGGVGGWVGGVADTNYLYPALWGWINIKLLLFYFWVYSLRGRGSKKDSTTVK